MSILWESTRRHIPDDPTLGTLSATNHFRNFTASTKLRLFVLLRALRTTSNVLSLLYDCPALAEPIIRLNIIQAGLSTCRVPPGSCTGGSAPCPEHVRCLYFVSELVQKGRMRLQNILQTARLHGPACSRSGNCLLVCRFQKSGARPPPPRLGRDTRCREAEIG
jgi:hypothetical protein